jgi:indolepyruvate ferredoxin oxidoreductase alpha subunit
MAAFALSFSEEMGLPVMLRSVTRLSHGKADVVVGVRQAPGRAKGFERDPERFVMVPSHARRAGRRLQEKQAPCY